MNRHNDTWMNHIIHVPTKEETKRKGKEKIQPRPETRRELEDTSKRAIMHAVVDVEDNGPMKKANDPKPKEKNHPRRAAPWYDSRITNREPASGQGNKNEIKTSQKIAGKSTEKSGHVPVRAQTLEKARKGVKLRAGMYSGNGGSPATRDAWNQFQVPQMVQGTTQTASNRGGEEDTTKTGKIHNERKKVEEVAKGLESMPRAKNGSRHNTGRVEATLKRKERRENEG
ncbi:hypothetical protein B0H16DRAFT_1462429 [Mycena metata]|uniref:Uncharacterized protein n=1 Tax=Mycena metata TaxID=1033252 RepID=A0AAD7N5D1_9AGAR|nr:hypothetical protein B0H16DRAFT_1462429 [Mycena metata]